MARVAAGRQVLGVDTDAVFVEKPLDRAEKLQVQRRRAAERERQAVTDEGKTLGVRAEEPCESTAYIDPVLGRDLQEVDPRLERLLTVQRTHESTAQPQSGTGQGCHG